ncbi:MAG: hypothetical protein ACRD63_14270, partial [Pyrinomonadaceae bacterium]
MLAEAVLPIKLTFRLWWRFWPQLFAVVLLGVIASNILMQLAVDAAFANHYAGLALLTLVALAQLVTTVCMIQIIRPGLPALNAAQEKRQPDNGEDTARKSLSRLATMVSVALIPFFAYYAAWGFLANTVRQYSRAALEQMPFGESGGNVLDVLDSRWIHLSVAVSWAVRQLAKIMKEKTGQSVWQIIMVVCETNWVFIGLYIVSRWKDSWMKALSEGNLWGYVKSLVASLSEPVSSAYAAVGFIPVEQTPQAFSTVAVSLFFHA